MSDRIPGEVCLLFHKFAAEIKHQGFRKYSADAILHRIRWHMQIDRGEREFVCNNNWTPILARWLMANYPAEFAGFFETRKRSSTQ